MALTGVSGPNPAGPSFAGTVATLEVPVLLCDPAWGGKVYVTLRYESRACQHICIFHNDLSVLAMLESSVTVGANHLVHLCELMTQYWWPQMPSAQ